MKARMEEPGGGWRSDGSQQHLFEAFIQIGLLSVTSRGGYFQGTPVHFVGSILSKLKGFRSFLVTVDAFSLILFQLFDHFSISECLRRAGGRKYSRG